MPPSQETRWPKTYMRTGVEFGTECVRDILNGAVTSWVVKFNHADFFLGNLQCAKIRAAFFPKRTHGFSVSGATA